MDFALPHHRKVNLNKPKRFSDDKKNKTWVRRCRVLNNARRCLLSSLKPASNFPLDWSFANWKSQHKTSRRLFERECEWERERNGFKNDRLEVIASRHVTSELLSMPLKKRISSPSSINSLNVALNHFAYIDQFMCISSRNCSSQVSKSRTARLDSSLRVVKRNGKKKVYREMALTQFMFCGKICATDNRKMRAKVKKKEIEKLNAIYIRIAFN